MLTYLARHAGRVVVPAEVLAAVWGPDYREETQHVRLYVSRSRQKIEQDPEHPRHLLIKPGIGYLLTTQDEPA